ncbi:7357_t:CDS:1, partial [Diversispora eburnea]
TPFDILHNENTSARRRHRNRTPPPTYRGVTPMLSRRESTTNQRNQFASSTQRIHSERGENNNRNNVGGDNATYSSSSELANITSGLNISASQNSSDFSMPDVGGSSQLPSYMEPINEEER